MRTSFPWPAGGDAFILTCDQVFFFFCVCVCVCVGGGGGGIPDRTFTLLIKHSVSFCGLTFIGLITEIQFMLTPLPK